MKYTLIAISALVVVLNTYANNKIFNGDFVKEGQYRNVISFSYEGRSYCTGTLVDPLTVVTAAHCLRRYKTKERDFSIAKLYIGEGAKDGKFEGQYELSSYWIHPFYNIGYQNDVGIVRLKNPITDPKVQFTPVPSKKEIQDILFANQPLKVVGFGRTEDNGFGEKKSVDILLNHVDFEEFSAGGRAGHDSCNGDSGGPVFFESNGQKTLIGIVSRSMSGAIDRCGEGGVYGFASDTLDLIKVAKLYENTQKFIEEKSYDKALAELDKAIAINKFDIRLHKLKVEILEKLELDTSESVLNQKLVFLLDIKRYFRDGVKGFDDKAEFDKIKDQNISKVMKYILEDHYLNKDKKGDDYDMSAFNKLVELEECPIIFKRALLKYWLKKEDYEKVLSLGRIVISEVGIDSSTYEYMIKSLYKLDRVDESLAYTNDLLAFNSFQYYGNFTLARSLNLEGKKNEALGFLELSTSLYKTKDALKLKYDLELELELTEQSIKTKIDLDYVQAKESFVKARSLKYKNENEEAEKLLPDFIDILGEKESVAKFIFRLYRDLKKADKAEEQLLKIYNRKVTRSVLEDLYSFYSYYKENKDLALKYVNELVEKYPRYTSYESRGNHYLSTQEYDLAEKDFLKSLELKESIYVITSIAQLYMIKQQYQESIKYLEKCLAWEGKVYQNCNYSMSEAYLNLEDLDKAHSYFKKAMEEEIYSYQYDTYVTIMTKRGQLDEALKEATALIEKDPKKADFYYFRYSVYTALKLYDLATKDMETYTKLSSGN
jgi:tetratricopeptide (TPR) repeat protein/V8-like Glu-specific endopeptidase